MLESRNRNLVVEGLYAAPYPGKEDGPGTLLFVGISGVPYGAKNYIMALAGKPLRYYLGTGWPAHFAPTIPVIGLGGVTAKPDLALSIFSGPLFVEGYLVTRWLKCRFDRVSH